LRKPVIASFGDVAASGGYYIASAASQIIAEPSTITGSIGVFAGKADLSKLLDSIGITTQTFKRGEHADLFTLTRPWTPEERHVVEGMVSTFYEAFVKRVAIGRKMTVEQVKAVAEGRVWTGAQAKDKGLVDSLGGLEEALKEARREAGLPSNAHVAVTGARGLFDLPDASATVAALQGRSRVDAPSALIALHDLFAGTAQGRSIDEAWPLLQALMEGRPLALALDVPIAR
jgi:protease-4